MARTSGPIMPQKSACSFLLELRGNLAVGLAERHALIDHESMCLLCRMNGRVEPDALGAETDGRNRRRQDVERGRDGVDAAEQRCLDELQITLIPRGELRAQCEHF